MRNAVRPQRTLEPTLSARWLVRCGRKRGGRQTRNECVPPARALEQLEAQRVEHTISVGLCRGAAVGDVEGAEQALAEGNLAKIGGKGVNTVT